MTKSRGLLFPQILEKLCLVAGTSYYQFYHDYFHQTFLRLVLARRRLPLLCCLAGRGSEYIIHYKIKSRVCTQQIKQGHGRAAEHSSTFARVNSVICLIKTQYSHRSSSIAETTKTFMGKFKPAQFARWSVQLNTNKKRRHFCLPIIFAREQLSKKEHKQKIPRMMNVWAITWEESDNNFIADTM